MKMDEVWTDGRVFNTGENVYPFKDITLLTMPSDLHASTPSPSQLYRDMKMERVSSMMKGRSFSAV